MRLYKLCLCYYKLTLLDLFLFILLIGILTFCVGCHWGRVPLPENPKAGDLWEIEINGLPYRFRWCPPGEFIMGWTEKERQLYEDRMRPFYYNYYYELTGKQPEIEELQQDVEEKNRMHYPHKVTFTKGFWILETEVTQQMFVNIMGFNNSHFQGEQKPVTELTIFDCRDFVFKLNKLCKLSGRNKFYVPTEAEWEYACRAGTQTVYNYGDEADFSKMNVSEFFVDYNKDFWSRHDRTGIKEDQPPKNVGSYPPNNWGIYDMHGNVAEFCNTRATYYPRTDETDPTGSLFETKNIFLAPFDIFLSSLIYIISLPSDIVVRGGAWRSEDIFSTSSFRDPINELCRPSDVGFRIVIDTRIYDL